MTTIRVEPARRSQCGIMARKIRGAHAERIATRTTHELIVAMFGASYDCRAGYIDDELVAIGGVAGTMASDTGFIWLALADIPAKHALRATLEMRRQLADITVGKRRILSTLVVGDDKASRLADLMGFKPVTGEIKPSGSTGLDMVEIALTR